MNLNDFSRALHNEIERANTRLLIMLDILTGPKPEVPSGVNPAEPGLIGAFQTIGRRVQDIHSRLDELDNYFLMSPTSPAQANHFEKDNRLGSGKLTNGTQIRNY